MRDAVAQGAAAEGWKPDADAARVGCVANVGCYEPWRSRGAHFITEPKTHETEKRCYMRDPDGYLIEVGQTTMTAGPYDLYR
jgi:hypothetical protein